MLPVNVYINEHLTPHYKFVLSYGKRMVKERNCTEPTHATARQQMVQINGVESDLKSIQYGVVQGSTLWPLLFLIYINNLPKLNVTGSLYLFADDTALLVSGDTRKEMYETAVSDLAKLKKWLYHNTLTLNEKKTKYMEVSLRNTVEDTTQSLMLHSCNDLQISSCGCPLMERVKCYKYLGVMFDENLNRTPEQL
ncbi:uncharacterized protein LOC120354573 [Nilaparvata lugens]|uniref:uncharacterized protein LOC120354573 n=1 Tax=Nilaparvata lugens TaxID=108931 RepID=UPI00193DFA1F|nr:uncharacterized protein LOC120354573 [Nilaparvata lugens]